MADFHKNLTENLIAFYSYPNILQYFKEIQCLLRKKSNIKSHDFFCFLKCVTFLEQNNALKFSLGNCTEAKECSKVLHEIFFVICDEYFQLSCLKPHAESLNFEVALFDLFVLLVKVLLDESTQHIYGSLQNVFYHLIQYFQSYTTHNEKYNISPNERDHLHHTSRFLCKLLKSFDKSHFSACINQNLLLEIVDSLPFSDKFVVNLFVNQILPFLIKMSEPSKNHFILDHLWLVIKNNFKESGKNFDEAHLYVLLYAVFEYVFPKDFKLSNFSVSDNILYEMIQNGLTSSSLTVRKQVIYLFRMFLFWVKSKKYVTQSSQNVNLFCVKSEKDVAVWDDFLTLYEVLEEKQIHVIKPVLPKFSRIMQHSLKKDSMIEETMFLHPSWFICFIRRMLDHESKFIVKEGLFLVMNLKFEEYNMELLHSKMFLKKLLEAVNDQNLYCRTQENDGISFLSSQKITTFLNSYVSAFDTLEQKADFLRYLLQSISCQSWCSVALMHLTFAMTNMKCMPAWSSNHMRYIRNILEVSLKSFESVIRNAIETWILKSCLNFLDWKSVNFVDLSEIFFTFKSLHRHSNAWNECVAKLKELLSSGENEALSVHEAKIFSINNIERMLNTHSSKLKHAELEKSVRLLLILADCGIILPKENERCLVWPQLLLPLSDILMDAPKRPYLSSEKFHNILQFYLTLVTESKNGNKSKNDAHVDAIRCSLNCSSGFIEFLFKKLFIELENIDDILQFHTICNAFSVFVSLPENFEVFLKLLPDFIVKCQRVSSELLSRNIVIILLYLSLNSHLKHFQLLGRLISASLCELNFALLSQIIKEHIVDHLTKSESIHTCCKNTWNELSSKYLCMFWQVTANVLNAVPVMSMKYINDLLFQQILCSLDGGPKSAVSSCIFCIQSLLPKMDLTNSLLIKGMIDSAWTAVSELRGTEAFRLAFYNFACLLCQPCLMCEDYADFLCKYINALQKNSVNTLGTSYVIIKQFSNNFPIKGLVEVKFDYVPVLIHSLTYGPIHHKNQKILEDTVAFLKDQDQYFTAVDFNKPSFLVRVVSIAYLMKSLSDDCSNMEEIVLLVINSLLDLDNSARMSKSSKFTNSYSHRLRNRIWQCILLLQSKLVSCERIELLYHSILDTLENDNQQPSVRYLQEWVIFNSLYDKKHFIEKFISKLESSFAKRPGLLVSLLSVLFHLIKCGFISCEELASRIFILLLHYCMAQNFAVRLYGRLAISKLFSVCENKQFFSTIEKFSFLSCSEFQIPEVAPADKGNIYKNLIRLAEDFYFSTFNPIQHFTFETVFIELPRLSNISPEEWIEPKYFSDEIDSDLVSIPCFNSSELLRDCVASSWADKDSDEPTVNAAESNTVTFDYNFQRKICPVKPYTIEPSLVDHDLAFNCELKSDLIVVASLIDRIPNLGGLCRTCEIFGVSQFVIGSLKYAEDKQFQNLAVSADKWMSMKEVKPYHLKEYLLSLKDDGYTLVGAEQTDDGQKLNEYIFPKKSAIVLGHEKEGMPVDLIQLLDVCVEIPQKGVIRSLNVHVSGAVFIWEYVKQHMKNDEC